MDDYNQGTTLSTGPDCWKPGGRSPYAEFCLCRCAPSRVVPSPVPTPRLRASVPLSQFRIRIEGAAMAMAVLREASRCLASRGSPAASRPVLLAQSRGITYKLFVGGCFSPLNCPSPPPFLSPFARVPLTSWPVECSAASLAFRWWREAHLLSAWFVARACVPSVRRNALPVQTRRLDADWNHIVTLVFKFN